MNKQQIVQNLYNLKADIRDIYTSILNLNDKLTEKYDGLVDMIEITDEIIEQFTEEYLEKKNEKRRNSRNTKQSII